MPSPINPRNRIPYEEKLAILKAKRLKEDSRIKIPLEVIINKSIQKSRTQRVISQKAHAIHKNMHRPVSCSCGECKKCLTRQRMTDLREERRRFDSHLIPRSNFMYGWYEVAGKFFRIQSTLYDAARYGIFQQGHERSH